MNEFWNEIEWMERMRRNNIELLEQNKLLCFSFDGKEF